MSENNFNSYWKKTKTSVTDLAKLGLSQNSFIFNLSIAKSKKNMGHEIHVAKCINFMNSFCTDTNE